MPSFFLGIVMEIYKKRPNRINREHHGIDRKRISSNALKVCSVLRNNGYSAYIVGGAIRDLIIGFNPKDFDVTTNATPKRIIPLFRKAMLIGKRFQIVHVVFCDEIIETSTFRATNINKIDSNGIILFDNVFGTQEEDAYRRDFTMNALYYDPITEEVIDYHHGVEDLKNRKVCIIGDPVTRYREDPVRMLRAMRFSAKLDSVIEKKTIKPIRNLSSLIKNVPTARLFEESIKLLTCGNSIDCIRKLRGLGMSTIIDVLFDPSKYSKLVKIALKKTDDRVRSGKNVSPSFIFSAILWPRVDAIWKKLCDDCVQKIPALVKAAGFVIEKHNKTFSIYKRFFSDIREIWVMQPRFELRYEKAVYRLVSHPRFNMACKFFQLRSESGECDRGIAKWWLEFYNANDNKRKKMINYYNFK